MKKSFNSFVTTLFILSFSLAVHAENLAPCKVADELVAAGELTTAREHYTTLLKATPSLECARIGLDKTRARELEAEKLWRRGNDLLLSGQQEEARAAWLNALNIDASREDIRKQFASLLDNQNQVSQSGTTEGENSDPYAVAKGLMVAGYETEAKKKALEIWNKGIAEPIPPKLQANEIDRFAERASDVGISAGKIGSALLAILLLIWILALTIRKLWLQRPWAKPRPCQVIIDEIDDPRTDLKVGHDLRERLAEELSHASSPATRLSRVSQPGATPIPQVENLPSAISFLGPLLRWARTPVRYHVVTEVHLPVNKVAALSVTIHNDRGELEVRESFSMKIEDEERVTYLELGTLAGAWVVFELQRLQFPKSRAHELRVLGTTRWKSYGMFRRGERVALTERICGHDSRDMKFFDHALAEDHNNIGALIVVGKWQSRNVTKQDEMKKGIEHLQRARRLLGDDSLARAGRFRAVPGTRKDPLWFQATYELAVAYLHRFASSEEYLNNQPTNLNKVEYDQFTDQIRGDLKNGLNVATELAKAIGATQLTLGRRWGQREIPANARRSLKLMLHQDAKYLIGVLAGSKASSEWIENGHLFQKNKKKAPPSLVLDDALWNWMCKLEYNNLPSARDLVQVVEDKKENAGWATLYNLACFYSRAREAVKAYDYLEQYFEHLVGRRKEIQVTWAKCDPTLKLAREDNKMKAKFDKLLTLPPPTPIVPQLTTPKAPAGEWVVEHFEGP
ncbi:MAG: hypothetical protein AMJ53_05175 [Gammaproteobacteria bacterium SG8_11]|nr:MAG: hypothetical protein AMJ53_05175 [Gammaproteobacteria bacterium SG8_11]